VVKHSASLFHSKNLQNTGQASSCSSPPAAAAAAAAAAVTRYAQSV